MVATSVAVLVPAGSALSAPPATGEPASSAPASGDYSVTNLGSVVPAALNDADTALVFGRDSDAPVPSIWAGGEVTALPSVPTLTPERGFTSGFLNAAGDVVATELSSSGTEAVAYWKPDGNGAYTSSGSAFQEGDAYTLPSGIDAAGDLGLTIRKNPADGYINSGVTKSEFTGPFGTKPTEVPDAHSSVGVSDVSHVDDYTNAGSTLTDSYSVTTTSSKTVVPLDFAAEVVAANGVIAGQDPGSGDLVVRDLAGRETEGPPLTPTSVDDAGDVVGWVPSGPNGQTTAELVPAGSTVAVSLVSLLPPNTRIGSVFGVVAINDSGDILAFGYTLGDGEDPVALLLKRSGLRSTTTSVSCAPSSAHAGYVAVCTTVVRDTGSADSFGSPSAPDAVESVVGTGPHAVSNTTCYPTTTTATTASCHFALKAPTASGAEKLTVGYAGDDQHAASAGSTSYPVVAPSPKPKVTLLSTSSKVASGHVKITLHCAGARCSGKAVLAMSKVIGTASYTLKPQQTGAVSIPLSAAGKRKLAKASLKHPIPVGVSVTVTGGGTVAGTVKVT